MALVMEGYSFDPLVPQNYDVLGDLLYGSNGAQFGSPEFDLEDSLGDIVSGRRVWDSNLSDGFDSGWCRVQMIVDIAGTALSRWSVQSSTLSISTPPLESISQVEIRAGVTDAQAKIEWGSLSVTFYDMNGVADYYSTAGGPSVDRTQITDPGTEVDILTVTSQVGGINRVKVSGYVRMTSPQGVYLAANSVFSQVLVRGEAA